MSVTGDNDPTSILNESQPRRFEPWVRAGSLSVAVLALLADIATLGVLGYQFKVGEISVDSESGRSNILWNFVFIAILAIASAIAYSFGSKGKDTKLLSSAFAFLYCLVATATFVAGGISGLWGSYVYLAGVAFGATVLATILIRVDNLSGQAYSLTFMFGGLILPVALINTQLDSIWWRSAATEDPAIFYVNMVTCFLSLCLLATWFILMDRLWLTSSSKSSQAQRGAMNESERRAGRRTHAPKEDTGRPRLVVVGPNGYVGKSFDLTETTTVGKSGQCEIVLNDEFVSARHAQLKLSGDDSEVLVEDMGSTNGTFVNGKRIDGIRTSSRGDSIQVGGVTFLLE